jgi:hypothetical protein
MRQENRKLAKEIGHEVREGMNKNFERGLRTNRSMDVSDARRLAHKLAGGSRISRPVSRSPSTDGDHYEAATPRPDALRPLPDRL